MSNHYWLADTAPNLSYIYENRPDSRTKHSLFWETKYALKGGDVIDASTKDIVGG